MRKEIIIRLQPASDKCRRKALKVAASVGEVESVAMTGRGKDLLLVVGDVDEVALTRKLKEEVGAAEIMELRALPGDALATDIVVTQSQSPYRHWRPSAPGPSVPRGGRITECPAAAAARWQGDHRSRLMGCYPGAPSPLQHQYPSPLAGQAGHAGYGYAGSGYELAAARSHPANYSPMITRHDIHAVGRTPAPDVGRGREHAGAGPNCCSIL